MYRCAESNIFKTGEDDAHRPGRKTCTTDTSGFEEKKII